MEASVFVSPSHRSGLCWSLHCLFLGPGPPVPLPVAAQAVLKEVGAEGSGVSKLDEYEIEGEASQEETLQNLTEFQLAAVSHSGPA